MALYPYQHFKQHALKISLLWFLIRIYSKQHVIGWRVIINETYVKIIINVPWHPVVLTLDFPLTFVQRTWLFCWLHYMLPCCLQKTETQKKKKTICLVFFFFCIGNMYVDAYNIFTWPAHPHSVWKHLHIPKLLQDSATEASRPNSTIHNDIRMHMSK